MKRFPGSTQSPLLCLAIALACAASAHAQSASSGAFGNRSMGSSFTPSGSSFGGTGASGMAPGFGGVGAGGMGGAGGGVAGATTRGDNSAGQITGSERFVRGARQPGQFVGSDSADTTNFMSQLSAYSALQSGLGRNNSNASNANRQSGMGNSRVKMPRIQQSVGFDYVPPKAETVDAVLQSRYALSPRMSRIGSIAVRMEGRTAILTGVVATAHDRALAEQVANLEAGVSGVRNELTIVPTFAVPAAAAPPAKAAASEAVLPSETPSVPRK